MVYDVVPNNFRKLREPNGDERAQMSSTFYKPEPGNYLRWEVSTEDDF